MMETYHGVVRTPADAIKLFEACRVGLLPRVQRRLSEKERQAIRSGSVFVWDEREAGMRRWTDGKSWSASRVSGSFLTYREMEGKRGNGFSGNRRGAGKTPDSGRGSDEDRDEGEPDGYRYKADGLMKQSFSITTSTGQHLHLISYYSRLNQDLIQPTNDPQLRGVVPVKGMYPESSLNETPVPALTRTPMQQPYGPPHAPHHPHPGYSYQQPPPPQYWPPSPVATPPYSHAAHYTSALPYAHGPPPPHQYGPPHPHQHPHPQPYPHPHHYGPPPPGPPPPHPHPYDRAQLPPPHPSQHPAQQGPLPPRNPMPLPQPYSAPAHSPHPHAAQPPPRIAPIDSPRSQHLQAAAREAVQIDPRLGTNHVRGSQGHSGPPLLALITPQQPGSAHTPPTRALSPSPPKSSHSDSKGPVQTSASREPRLSALLHPHPSPSSSEPNSANPGSAGSANNSPKGANGTTTTALPPLESRPKVNEDSRALDRLNRNFGGM